MSFYKKILSFFNKKKNVDNTYHYKSDKYSNFKCININNIIRRNIIPYNCYYICVGGLNRSTINYSINSFKEQNEKFNVEVLDFSYDDFFKHKYTYKILQDLNLTSVKCLNNIQLISVINSFKYKLLYDYGGVVLDNCTYTLCNIDKYLNNDSFIYTCINSDYKINKNYCFMGSIKQYKGVWNSIYPPMDYNMVNYQTLKIAFNNNKLYKDVYIFNNWKLNCPVWDFSR